MPATSSAAEARQYFVYQMPHIKGMCVLAVIAIHVTGIFAIAGRVDYFTAVLILANSLARFAVPVFILLSGFYLSLNARNERAIPFYGRTLKLLLVPYAVYSALYIVATRAWGANFVLTWLWAMAQGTAYGHLWFIPVMLELYLIHPFLRRWYRRIERRGAFVAIALLVQIACDVLGQLILANVARSAPWLAAASILVAFLPYVGYLALGYFLLDHAADVVAWIRRPPMKTTAATVWVVTAGLVAAYWVVPLLGGQGLNSIAYPRLARTLLAPPLSIAAFLVLAAPRTGRGAPRPAAALVHMCGLYAYGVYFLHPLVLLAVSWALTDGGGLSWNGIAFYVVAFPLVSILSVFSIKVLIRLPYTRYLA